jgi:hypothetical protein
MGLIAETLSPPLGWLMAHILIQVVNLRSFGWTMPTRLPAEVPFEALSLALTAALLAWPGPRVAGDPGATGGRPAGGIEWEAAARVPLPGGDPLPGIGRTESGLASAS